MKLSRLSIACACAALLSLPDLTQAAELTASGKVLGADGKPLSDVTVTLALAKTSATTDASGAWDLGSTPAGIASRVAVPVVDGRLVLEGGRLSVRFDGREVSGRGMVRGVAVSRPLARAAGEADIPDTLLYTWKGKVRLRDTISASQTGIVRTLDTTVNSSIVHGYLTDSRDGQVYRTVKIGAQTWMAQNLNHEVSSSWWYDNSAENGAKYGRLYQWAVVMGLNDTCNAKSCARLVTGKHRGVCPLGWHVPSFDEWIRLMDTIMPGTKTDTSTNLKANGSQWSIIPGTDDYGFRALPAGYRYRDGEFRSLGSSTYFWFATEFLFTENAWIHYFYNDDQYVDRYGTNKNNGGSLRCLQD